MSRAILLHCTLFGSLLATPVMAKEPCHQDFAFRANPMIGLGAIKRLSNLDLPTDPPHTKDGAQLVVWPFDEEDHPAFGAYRGLAIVFATRNDLGEETAGGLLLQNSSAPPLAPGKLAVKQMAGNVVLELPARGACPPFVVKLVDGGAIYAQGKLVGRLR
jgi:hypothetical protein